MTGPSRSRWGFLLVEAALIVLSILLAFAIEAWWDGRQEDREQLRLLRGFQEDLRTDSATYAGLLESYPATVESHEALLGWLTGEGPELDAVEVVRAVRLSILLPILFSKERTTYEEAVQVGGLARMEDGRLRRALIAYYSVPFAVTNDAFVEGWLEGVYFPFERRLRGALGTRYHEIMACGTRDDDCLERAALDFDPAHLRRADGLVEELVGVGTYSLFWRESIGQGAESRDQVARLVAEALGG